MSKTEPVSTSTSTSKASDRPRKVYNRRGVVHICWAGSHWANPTETKVDHKRPACRLVENADGTITVHQHDSHTDNLVTETWVKVTVPRSHRANTVRGFRKASAAQLTGWTY